MKTAWTIAMFLAFTLAAAAVPAAPLPEDGETASLAANCGNDVVDLGEQCDGTSDVACPGHVQRAVRLPAGRRRSTSRAAAQPPHTPGSPGVVVTNAKLLTQFGADLDLNNARYTRFELDDSGAQPDAILILVPGFEGGANNFRILAQNLLGAPRRDHDLRLEVWAFDRRTNQLEDTSGLDLAEAAARPVAGRELAVRRRARACRSTRASSGARCSTTRRTTCRSSPTGPTWSSRATSTRSSTAALARARNRNVFLGGHSAGTGFTARYAATDFDITPGCDGVPDPGYAKLRGLVLLEGGGGSTSGAGRRSRDDTLDRVIAKFDGGLYGAVRDNAPRCVDGDDAVHASPPRRSTAPARCRRNARRRRPPYALVPGVLNPRVLAVVRGHGHPGLTDLNTRPASIGQLDIGAPGNKPAAKVPDLAGLGIIPPRTVEGSFGTFLNKNGVIAPALSFVAMSVGEPGPTVDGVLTWKDILHGPLSPDRTSARRRPRCRRGRWGVDKEVTRLDRVVWTPSSPADQLQRLVLPERRPEHDRGDQSRLDQAVGAAAARARPLRHREPHPGGEHRHSGHRLLRQRRPGDGARRLRRLRPEHRHRARRRAATAARRASSTPPTPTRRFRPSATSTAASRSTSTKASPTSTCDRRGQRRQPRRCAALRLHRAQRGCPPPTRASATATTSGR